MTDVFTVYLEGKKWFTWDEVYLVPSFPGGGRLGLSIDGPISIYFTSFNMWDHVLSDDVIKEQASSCNGAIGNVKEWFDVWSVLQSLQQSNYYTKPSTCSAPIPPAADLESGPSADHLKSSGKSPFAKYKKKKSSFKDGS